MQGYRLQQMQEVNRQPLNQEVKSWLEQAIKPEVPTDWGGPYSLQLAWWAVDRPPDSKPSLTVETERSVPQTLCHL